jgi:hypothetical protein
MINSARIGFGSAPRAEAGPASDPSDKEVAAMTAQIKARQKADR